MKILKIAGQAILGLATLALIVFVTWGVLYLCVPTIKDKTDKTFHWGDYVEAPADDKKDDEQTSTATGTAFVFENNLIKITVG